MGGMRGVRGMIQTAMRRPPTTKHTIRLTTDCDMDRPALMSVRDASSDAEVSPN